MCTWLRPQEAANVFGAAMFLPLGFSKSQVLKGNCLSWPASLAGCSPSQEQIHCLHPGVWAEGWGRGSPSLQEEAGAATGPADSQRGQK